MIIMTTQTLLCQSSLGLALVDVYCTERRLFRSSYYIVYYIVILSNHIISQYIFVYIAKSEDGALFRLVAQLSRAGKNRGETERLLLDITVSFHWSILSSLLSLSSPSASLCKQCIFHALFLLQYFSSYFFICYLVADGPFVLQFTLNQSVCFSQSQDIPSVIIRIYY